MYHSIVLFSPSSNVNSGLHPTRSYALELSNALDNAPTGLEVSNLISFGCHPIILKINFATSVIVYLDPVPRFIGVQISNSFGGFNCATNYIFYICKISFLSSISPNFVWIHFFNCFIN